MIIIIIIIIVIIIIINMLMPVKVNSFTPLRALLILRDRGILAHAPGRVTRHYSSI
jgi:hypothetical protein